MEKLQKKEARLERANIPLWKEADKYGIDLNARWTGNNEFKISDRDERVQFEYDVQEKYWNNCRDLRETRDKIKSLENILSRLEKKLEQARLLEVPQVIKDFCDEWYQTTLKYFLEHHDNGPKDTFRWFEKGEIAKYLRKEADQKEDEIAIRVQKKCGKILDASDLKIGKNGTINGTIIGEKGTAHVETIVAGGYNIQQLHFRVLIK